VSRRRDSVGDVLLRAGAGLAVAILVAFLALPLLGLILRAPAGDLVRRLRQPAILEALRLSLETSLAATAAVVLLGVPLAYLLATREFRGKRILETLVDLPMVLPPTVAGLALLLAFGRSGLLGAELRAAGLSIPFTTLAVVLAQVFMAAPFFVGPARDGFAAVDHRVRDVAATLGAGEALIFRRVMLPLARPALAGATAMACARALGEFGATITFAGNLAGVTRTMPLAVYVELQSDLDAAITLSVILLLVSGGLLLALRAAPRRAR
jgi:molybdate transport system permease protein